MCYTSRLSSAAYVGARYLARHSPPLGEAMGHCEAGHQHTPRAKRRPIYESPSRARAVVRTPARDRFCVIPFTRQYRPAGSMGRNSVATRRTP